MDFLMPTLTVEAESRMIETFSGRVDKPTGRTGADALSRRNTKDR